MVCVLLLALNACQRRPELKPALMGTWVTDAAAYTGRSFTIEAPNKLVFQFGASADSANVRRVRAVQERYDPSRNITYYRIEYREGNDVVHFSIYLFAEPGPVIRFKNQPEIAWKPAQS
jgi:hypothetical protein